MASNAGFFGQSLTQRSRGHRSKPALASVKVFSATLGKAAQDCRCSAGGRMHAASIIAGASEFSSDVTDRQFAIGVLTATAPRRFSGRRVRCASMSSAPWCTTPPGEGQPSRSRTLRVALPLVTATPWVSA